jgi:alpha-glucosidase
MQSEELTATTVTVPSGESGWWRKAVIYHLYPRSFQDSDGDGVGDLQGIISRLDYIQSLNVDAIWLSPIYPSPMRDFGYDVTDYTTVHPLFGTMSGFDQLLAETHRRGMRLLMDYVPNHTSDEHPWFLESRSSRDNPKRDWYLWRDPAPGGGPPNNWLSVFGGPAWTLDELTGQYYNHQFVPEQPDLNFRNPEVLEAMLEVMRFWLDRGVDGFRVDTIPRLLKDDRFSDEPPDPDWDGVDPYYSLLHIHTRNLPGVHGIIRRMRALLDEYPDRVLIGETYVSVQELMAYYGPDLDECHFPYNFQLIKLPWDARVIRDAVDSYEGLLPPGAWPNWVLGNHDVHRVASRIGQAQARVANMMLLTLRGTPTTYYGEEIGMENVPIPPEFVQDPPALKQPELAHILGRDPARTPMQWSGEPNAGFTREEVVTWLPVAGDYQDRNVERQERDPTSMLRLYRALTSLRRAEPALLIGDYSPVRTAAPHVIAYRRDAPGADSFLVILNLGNDAHRLDLSQVAPAATIAVSTSMARRGPADLSRLELAPDEGLVLRLAQGTGYTTRSPSVPASRS